MDSARAGFRTVVSRTRAGSKTAGAPGQDIFMGDVSCQTQFSGGREGGGNWGG